MCYSKRYKHALDTIGVTNVLRLNDAPIKIIVGSDAVSDDEASDGKEIDRGPHKETFYIDSGVLKQGGSFFVTALKEEWLEGQQRVINLPEEQPRIFRPYAQWLYTGKIYCGANGEDGGDEAETLCKLYTLGERVMDRPFQDSVMDVFVGWTKPGGGDANTITLPYANTVNHICEHAPRDSPARQLLVEVFSRPFSGNGKSEWAEYLKLIDHGFLVDLVLNLRAKLTSQRQDKKALLMQETTRKDHPRCRYHHHAEDQPCPGAQK